MNLDILREIILDFQRQPLPTGVPRELVFAHVPRKAFVCVGVRRAGKSTFLYQIVERLRREGVPAENILFVNLFDDRLRAPPGKILGATLDAYFSLYPEKKGHETVYAFFDEIQMAGQWEPFVDRVLRTENMAVYLSGSSAKLLSAEVATQMRGRALAWELFPFSFGEFLDAKGLPRRPRGSRERLLTERAFREYRSTGGFPEVVFAPERLRPMILQDYFKAIALRDVVERHDARHPRAIVDIAYRLLDNCASLHSINSLVGFLKSQGHKVTKSFVSDALGWFEDAFFLFPVKLFDRSLTRQNANPRKMYCVDSALVAAIASPLHLNTGHLLENLVFVHFRRSGEPIHYLRTRSGKEVDFVLGDHRRDLRVVQVCEDLRRDETREREVGALAEAMAELKIKEGVLVTLSETETIRVPQGTIRVVPAWRFILD